MTATRPPRLGGPSGGPRRSHRSGVTPLLGAVLLLAGVGLVMVLSASSVSALREHGTSWLFFQRQVVWLALGGVAMAVAANLDYRWWKVAAWPLLLTSAGLLVVVLVPSIGVSVSGSRRWIDLGITQFQPSELAKLGVLVFCADLLARRAAEIDDPRRTLQPVLIVLAVVGLLVLKEPDMGTTMIIVCIVGTLLYAAGIPLRWMGALAVIGPALAVVLALAEPYRRSRVLSFLDPWADAGNTGYQGVQALVGMGSGGIKGVGLGASRAKWGFLPNAHTDFIFAIIGEELGLLGGLLVVSLFGVLAAFGIRAALRARDPFGTLLAAGLTAWIVGQAVINIGAVIGLLPITGVPLPFVSAGGSALIVLMAAMGILLNVARTGVAPLPRQ